MSSSKKEKDFKYIKSKFIQDEADNIFNNIANFKKSKLSTQSLILKIFRKFNRKYNIMPKRYNSTVIDNIIFNEKSHIVSKFKDLLISYDFNDFLKRYYTKKESAVRLPKYFEYYNLYSKICPNYTSIPEGKYFYINIQKKQRMIDLQENMENEKSKERKLKKANKKEIVLNVFNTSVINSILNRTNKEEMEMLFDVNLDNTMEEEDKFANKINKLINNINSYEIKEDYYIDYNYESKNDKKNNKKEIISPLMNININYINFNKFNDVKTNSVSFNNQNNKNNILFNKIFNVPIKNKINNQALYNEKASFLMKINQIKQNKKTFHSSINYMINSNNSKLSFSKNTISSIGKNKSNNTKIKFPSKNKTIVYDYKSTNKEANNNNNNMKIEKGNLSLKNIFSYRTSFGYLSPNNKNNIKGIDLLPKKFPLSSRNKNNNDIESGDTNLYLTNHKYTNNNQPQNPKNNKSTLSKKENNLYVLINNSRNKIVLKNNHQLMPSSSTKLLNINNPVSPLTTKFKLKQKKKLKHTNNYSLLNNRILDKKKIWNIENNNNNNTVLKDNFYLNNFVKDENASIKNINKNINLLINKNNSIKTKKIYQNNSSRNLNLKQINRKINNKRDITGIYVNEFIKAFNNSKKLRNDFLSHRDKDI